jgi:protein-disulfide isomerase
MGRSLAVPIAIVLGAGIVGGAIYFAYGRSTGSESPESQQATAIGSDITFRPISDEDHVLGNPNAPLVIVEYADLECVFCKEFHNTMHRLMDEFGRDGRIAWVFRHFPIADLHSQAPTEALAAECVARLGGNSAFWTFIDTIYETSAGNNTLDLALLPSIAEGAGVSQAEFSACMQDGTLMARVERDFDDALRAGGTGTPHLVFVTDREAVPVKGAQPYLAMRSIVYAILQQKSGGVLTRPSEGGTQFAPTVTDFETSTTTP